MNTIKTTLLTLTLFIQVLGTAQAAPALLLTCYDSRPSQETDAGEAKVFLYRENYKDTLHYEALGVSYQTPIKMLSGVEWMGQQDEWLVFFEFLPSQEFMLSIIKLSDFTLAQEPTYLDCVRAIHP